MTYKPASLSEALQALDGKKEAFNIADAALRDAYVAKDYAAAMKRWKELHAAVLPLKDATNNVYRLLSELKPKTPKADKLKPGGAIDNPPAKKGKRAEPKVDEANSDEP